jgi:hypothetical protein
MASIKTNHENSKSEAHECQEACFLELCLQAHGT